MNVSYTESGAPVPVVEPPKRLLKSFDETFRSWPNKVNDFNTGVGFKLSDLQDLELSELRGAFEAQRLKFPQIATWSADKGKSLGLIEFIKLTMSVESHMDEGYGHVRFFVWVLDSKRMRGFHSRFNGRALFRYFDLRGKKQEVRLEPGMLIGFNQGRYHELLFMGEGLKLAVGTAGKL